MIVLCALTDDLRPSEGQVGLNPQVGESPNPVKFTPQNTTCAKSIFSEGILGTLHWASLTIYSTKPDHNWQPMGNIDIVDYWAGKGTQRGDQQKFLYKLILIPV